jgi:hypothetical protein
LAELGFFLGGLTSLYADNISANFYFSRFILSGVPMDMNCLPGFFEALTKSDALCKCASFLPRALFWDEPSIPLQKVTSLKSK